MNDKLKDFTRIFSKLTKNNKNLMIIVILGIVGIVLIAGSELFPSKESKNVSAKTEEITVSQYINTLEEKTKKMLMSVDGAGKCKIMITAESSALKQYATDDYDSYDIQSSGNQNKEKNEKQSEIVMVEEQNGRNQALVTNVLEPQIRGVLVVCEGADNPNVKEDIILSIKTLLGISSNKICVVKSK